MEGVGGGIWMLIFMQAFHNFIHTYDKSSFYMLVIGQVHFTYTVSPMDGHELFFTWQKEIDSRLMILFIHSFIWLYKSNKT